MKLTQEQIDSFLNVVRRILLEASHKIPYIFQALVMSEMGIAEVSTEWRNARPHAQTQAFPDSKVWWSEKVKLQTRTGGYVKSFLPNAEKSLTKIRLTSTKLDVQVGSEYFGKTNIHETGGKIKSKGHMHKYFWAKYFQSKNEFFKIVALSVMKRGYVKIPKRPTFAPAVERFKNEIAKQMLQQIIYELLLYLEK